MIEIKQENLMPCPFCGSSNIRLDTMYFDDDGEHPGVECLDCDGSNRLTNWNTRAQPTAVSKVKFYFIPEYSQMIPLCDDIDDAITQIKAEQQAGHYGLFIGVAGAKMINCMGAHDSNFADLCRKAMLAAEQQGGGQ